MSSKGVVIGNDFEQDSDEGSESEYQMRLFALHVQLAEQLPLYRSLVSQRKVVSNLFYSPNSEINQDSAPTTSHRKRRNRKK